MAWTGKTFPRLSFCDIWHTMVPLPDSGLVGIENKGEGKDGPSLEAWVLEL